MYGLRTTEVVAIPEFLDSLQTLKSIVFNQRVAKWTWGIIKRHKKSAASRSSSNL